MRAILLSLLMLTLAVVAEAAVVGDTTTNRGRQEEIMQELKKLSKDMSSLKISVQKSVSQMRNTINAMSAQVSLMQQSALMSQSAQLNELKIMMQEMTTGGDAGKTISEQMEAETRRLEKSLEEFKAQAMVKEVIGDSKEVVEEAPTEAPIEKIEEPAAQ